MTSDAIGTAADPAAWNRRLQATIAVLCGAVFLDAMDGSTVNIALPSIGSSLGLSASSLQWVVSGYVLGYGGFLLLGGRASDLLGRRKVFLAAVLIFALASCLGGFAQSGAMLIAARGIKGVAAAFTVPAGLSILTTTFPEGPARNKALGAYGVAAALGFVFGLVVGGLLAELGWRWVFFAPAPVGMLIAFAGARVLIRDPERAAGPRHFDALGALTVTGSMVALVYTVVEAPARGWLGGATLGGFAAAALLLAAFVVIEGRSPQPLVRMDIFRNLDLLSADIAGTLFFGSFLAFLFIATLYVQDVAGWSPIATAVAFAAMGPFLPILGGRAEMLIGRFGTGRLVALALVCFAVGFGLFAREQSGTLDYVTMMLPSMIAIGLGWGFGFPALNVRATAGVPDKDQGLAAGLLNTGLQIGGAIGVA
ncbi:MAG TPA: MFS transporter, partial [Solirubrobacterales bacterium]|nr:MFS transporter [Solirubrobacterales bacterium]